MRRLTAAGATFGFAVTLDRSNADAVADDSFLDSRLEHGAAFGWIYQRLPLGPEPDPAVMATASQRDQARRTIKEWQRKRPVPVIDFCMDGACTGGCTAASRTCHVAASGMVQPCRNVPFATLSIADRSLSEVFESDFFRRVRSMQPCDTNLLRPCMVVDHPDLLRTLVDQSEARPTFEGADAIVLKPAVRKQMDAYAREWAALAEEAWKGSDYRSGRSVMVPAIGRIDVRTVFASRMAQADIVTAMRKSMGDGFYPRPIVRLPVPAVESLQQPGAAA